MFRYMFYFTYTIYKNRVNISKAFSSLSFRAQRTHLLLRDNFFKSYSVTFTSFLHSENEYRTENSILTMNGAALFPASLPK